MVGKAFLAPLVFVVAVVDPERLAELVILAVLPDWRGQGVGSALLDAVEARLRELAVEDMVISVVTTNDDAMRLYRRRGAEPFVTELIQRVSPGDAASG